MMIQSLEQSELRLEELDRALMDPAVLSNAARLREITKERAHLEPIIKLWQDLTEARQQLADARELLSDPEMREMAVLEIAELEARIPDLEQALRVALIPPDPYEGRDLV